MPQAGVGSNRDAPPQALTRPGGNRPLLMVDIDGVISLFGPSGNRESEGSFHAIDGIPHFLSSTAATQLLSLAEDFDLVWCSGWEEKAEEYLPHLLGLPAGLPFLRFDRGQGAGRSIDGHWKLDAIDAYAGERALAWIDDAFDRVLPRLGHGAFSADAARGNRPLARAHVEGGAASGGVGACADTAASRRSKLARTTGHSSSMTL